MSTARATTEARAGDGVSSRQISMSKNDSGLKPRISSPATATAANTASTDVRPSSAQYTSCRCRISANSSSTSAAPIPKIDCCGREFGYSAVDRQSHHRDPGDHDQDHTDDHMVDVHPAARRRCCAAATTCAGLSLSAWLRMYRTIVRVTKNVRMNAIRHHISGIRPCGIARRRSPASGARQKTYADRRGDVPGIWSGAPRSADSLVCDMSTWRSPGGAGWWPIVAWRLLSAAHAGGAGLGRLAAARPHPVPHRHRRLPDGRSGLAGRPAAVRRRRDVPDPRAGWTCRSPIRRWRRSLFARSPCCRCRWPASPSR